MYLLKKRWTWWDSNPRSSAHKTDALTNYATCPIIYKTIFLYSFIYIIFIIFIYLYYFYNFYYILVKLDIKKSMFTL